MKISMVDINKNPYKKKTWPKIAELFMLASLFPFFTVSAAQARSSAVATFNLQSNEKLEKIVVAYGQSLQDISRQYGYPLESLIELNRITSPGEVYAGASINIPQPAGGEPNIAQAILQNGQSLLEAAAAAGENPWSLALSNDSDGTWDTLPGQRLGYRAAEENPPFETLSPWVDSIVINPLPFTQGNTVVIAVKMKRPARLTGSLGPYPLEFIQSGENQYIALQGVYAMWERGLYPLCLMGDFYDGTGFDHQQNVLVKPGYFPKDPPLTVPPETLDPAVTGPEDRQVANIVRPVTPDRKWSGPFVYPVDKPCLNSYFGDRRSYNGSDYIYFHTGVDFGTCANNLNIYAPAPGRVVFTGMLTVRGNTVIIDHGWGVYSGFLHQSRILVQIGQVVNAGELIGLVGATGRVNGPHLHWDLIQKAYP
jgi:murein DD-endopeptidase MepM/ murein hydrolase activator NlpD